MVASPGSTEALPHGVAVSRLVEDGAASKVLPAGSGEEEHAVLLDMDLPGVRGSHSIPALTAIEEVRLLLEVDDEGRS